MADQSSIKRIKGQISRESKFPKIEMEGVEEQISIKTEPGSPTETSLENYAEFFQEGSFTYEPKIKMEPHNESNFQISEETNRKANQSLVTTEIVEPEPIQVFVKGVYLTKERTKWMEVHHDVKKPRTVKTMKVAGFTAYREKYQEVHFDLKRWNELYAQKNIIENYLNNDESFLSVKKVKLSGNLKIVFKDETIGKFVTFSQRRNSVSMKGPTFSYMMKYNEWVQECLSVPTFDFQN